MLDRLRNLEAIHWLGLGFAAYALSRSHSLYAFCYFLSLCGAFYYGYRQHSQEPFWWAYLSITTLMIIAYSLSDLITINPNVLGAVFAIGLAAALAYQIWLFVPIMGIALLLTYSRTAIIAGGVAAFLWTWQRHKLVALLLATGAVAILVTISDGRGTSFFNRLGIWQDTLAHLTFWGAGLGSFADAYISWAFHTNMTQEIAGHAYNDYLELMFELGIGTILLWLTLIFAIERVAPEPKLILATFAVLSLAFFPLYIPFVAHAAAISLGHLIAGTCPRAFGQYA